MVKKSVLIVDDAQDVRKILKFHLKKFYVVREAHDGEEGLAKIRKEKPDLLILDINMPKMSGLTLYEKISAGAKRPPFAVIVLTVREELAALFVDLDADGFITKPFEMKKVLSEIKAVMEGRGGMKTGTASALSKGPKRILIAEPDPVLLGRLKEVFTGAGFIVCTAHSGTETVECIHSDPPDLLLIREGFRDIPGDIIIRKLKDMPKTSAIPCVLYAGTRVEDPQRYVADSVVRRIAEIAGTEIVESEDPDVLLKEAVKRLKSL